MNIIIKWFVYCSVAVAVIFHEAPYIKPGQSQHTIYSTYYSNSPPAIYGYATRYGSDTVAFNELLWEAHEYVAQRDHGFALIGGGYGYHTLNNTQYLAENRSSMAYGLLSANVPVKPTEQQCRLTVLASMTREQAEVYVSKRYIGIISLKSPNDIGREFCLMRYPSLNTVGVVIVGGTAARNDWAPFGPSLNDDYSHLRMGELFMALDGTDYRWTADLSDSVYSAMGVNPGAVLIALGPKFLCSNVCPIDK